MKQQKKSNCKKYLLLLKYIFPLITLVVAGNSAAQNAEELANTYIQDYLNNSIKSETIQQLNEKPADRVIAAFAGYTNDTISRIRRASYQIIYKTGLKAEKTANRKEAINYLIHSLDDSDAGIVGITIDYLCDFSPEDFDAEQRYLISLKVKQTPKPAYAHKIFLLSAYLGISELIYNYEKMLQDTATYTLRDRWYMLLAMARMDDQKAIDRVIDRIETLNINDDVVYDLYPKLAYIRQKASFDILFDAIMSDEKNCLSSNPDNEVPIVCAFRIIGYVAQYIEGFPIETDKYGEAIIENYDAELILVREWINKNRGNYNLIYDKY